MAIQPHASEPAAFPLTISDLGEPAYLLLKPIPLTIQFDDGAYLASFFDANIHASGDTDQEAYDNLRSMILDTFDTLDNLPETKLQPAAQRQRRVLAAYIGRSGK